MLREAVRLGINHIDTSDYYGPHVANQIIREAIHPYPKDLVIVTKIGAKRGPDKSWPTALSREELASAVEDNLRNLGLEALEIVKSSRRGAPRARRDFYRRTTSGPGRSPVQGTVRHIGLSNISPRQFAEAQGIAKIVCVQNHYNLAHRQDDQFIETLAARGIAYVPFFPLGGFRPLQSLLLDEAAAALGAKPRQVALAWLLRRSANILIVAGTSSVEHLHDNLKAASLVLPPDIIAKFDRISASAAKEKGGGTPAVTN